MERAETIIAACRDTMLTTLEKIGRPEPYLLVDPSGRLRREAGAGNQNERSDHDRRRYP